jgi:hypothetical protein
VDIIIITVGVVEVQLQRYVVNSWTEGLATCRRRSPATIVVHIFCPNSMIGRGLPTCPNKPKPEGTLSNDQFNPFQLNRHPLSSMKNEKSLHFPFNNIFHAFTFCVRKKRSHKIKQPLWVTEHQFTLKWLYLRSNQMIYRMIKRNQLPRKFGKYVTFMALLYMNW